MREGEKATVMKKEEIVEAIVGYTKEGNILLETIYVLIITSMKSRGDFRRKLSIGNYLLDVI